METLWKSRLEKRWLVLLRFFSVAGMLVFTSQGGAQSTDAVPIRPGISFSVSARSVFVGDPVVVSWDTLSAKPFSVYLYQYSAETGAPHGKDKRPRPVVGFGAGKPVSPLGSATIIASRENTFLIVAQPQSAAEPVLFSVFLEIKPRLEVFSEPHYGGLKASIFDSCKLQDCLDERGKLVFGPAPPFVVKSARVVHGVPHAVLALESNPIQKPPAWPYGWPIAVHGNWISDFDKVGNPPASAFKLGQRNDWIVTFPAALPPGSWPK